MEDNLETQSWLAKYGQGAPSDKLDPFDRYTR